MSAGVATPRWPLNSSTSGNASCSKSVALESKNACCGRKKSSMFGERVIWPVAGCQSPARHRKMEVLPEPFGPRITQFVPRSTVKDSLVMSFTSAGVSTVTSSTRRHWSTSALPSLSSRRSSTGLRIDAGSIDGVRECRPRDRLGDSMPEPPALESSSVRAALGIASWHSFSTRSNSLSLSVNSYRWLASLMFSMRASTDWWNLRTSGRCTSRACSTTPREKPLRALCAASSSGMISHTERLTAFWRRLKYPFATATCPSASYTRRNMLLSLRRMYSPPFSSASCSACERTSLCEMRKCSSESSVMACILPNSGDALRRKKSDATVDATMAHAGPTPACFARKKRDANASANGSTK
mmetsp:Transcript_44040/g.135929  ORF Transcript_44040/g.135929 Transcript_44040/m.135929 type:complete len:356 (-) Transcript_44040:645-1712(-)